MILDGLLPGASRARDQALAWRAPQPEDVDHRLRAALDALACQVAQHPCGAPTGGALHDALAALRGVSSGRL
ncbi:MAG TPA: hypothetical protein PKA64_12875, partial [Myxococcota bacterium]|nr:hypothetical protein [Myxococcota bacterium]